MWCIKACIYGNSVACSFADASDTETAMTEYIVEWWWWWRRRRRRIRRVKPQKVWWKKRKKEEKRKTNKEDKEGRRRMIGSPIRKWQRQRIIIIRKRIKIKIRIIARIMPLRRIGLCTLCLPVDSSITSQMQVFALWDFFPCWKKHQGVFLQVLFDLSWFRTGGIDGFHGENSHFSPEKKPMDFGCDLLKRWEARSLTQEVGVSCWKLTGKDSPKGI